MLLFACMHKTMNCWGKKKHCLTCDMTNLRLTKRMAITIINKTPPPTAAPMMMYILELELESANKKKGVLVNIECVGVYVSLCDFM